MEQKDIENKILAHEEILIELKGQMSRTANVVNEYFEALQRIREKQNGKLPDIDYRIFRIQAAIAAMPIADKIVDNLYGADYHNENKRIHTIDLFVEECVGIADALIEELKKEE